MSAAHFKWLTDGPPAKRIWRAALLNGSYEIEEKTLTAWFIKHPFISKTDGEMIHQKFTSLEAARNYCEQHWYLTIRRNERGDRSRMLDPG